MARIIKTGKWFTPNTLIVISIISIVVGLIVGIGYFTYSSSTLPSEKMRGGIGAFFLINGIINLLRGIYYKFE